LGQSGGWFLDDAARSDLVLSIFEFFVLEGELESQIFNVLFELVFVAGHLVALIFKRVDLFFLNQMQILLHLKLAL
jgi:hypothetical protein